jgi:transposase InsO family protein
LVPVVTVQNECHDVTTGTKSLSGESRHQARAALFDYIEMLYSRKRLHSTLRYLAPIEYKQVKRVG